MELINLESIDEALAALNVDGDGEWIKAQFVPTFLDLTGVRKLTESPERIFYRLEELVDILLDLRLDAMTEAEVLSA